MALAVVMTRFWRTTFPQARAQLRVWEASAAAIPDPALREHALDTLRAESLSAMGAALVATTVDPHNPALMRLLMAVQLAWDYIDTLAEQPAEDPVANGVALHRSLIDAVSPGASPGSAYYRHCSSDGDGGYLAALVRDAHDACVALPAFTPVQATVLRELRKAEVQYLNHAPAHERVPALRRWATWHGPVDRDGHWLEPAAAASSSLGVLAMLSTAADPATTVADVAQTRDAYVPWVDALTALLDSLVDRAEDETTGLMNWIAHYPSDAIATVRLQQITLRAISAARQLPHGERHVVIVAGMIAMHLSQATARHPGTQPMAEAVLRATGTPVTTLLLVLLRVWRAVRAGRGRGASLSAAARSPRACARACAPSGDDPPPGSAARPTSRPLEPSPTRS